MSTMTLEQEFEKQIEKLPMGAQQNIKDAMSRGESLSFDMFKAGWESYLARQSEGVGEEVTPEILAKAVCARNKEYTRAQQAGEPRNEGRETLAALTAVWHNRPAQEPPEGHSVQVLSHDGEWKGEARWEYQERAYVTQEAVRPAQEKAEPVEMSPEFTDSARGAIARVLYHHQGGSSPVGQPLRFALGMGAHERLSADRIADAKRYAAWAGATTEQFHRPPAERVRVPDGWKLVPVEPTDAMAYAAMNDNECSRPEDSEVECMKQGYRAMLAAAPEVTK